MPPEVDEQARSFVSTVLDHSASVGVRGEFTAKYLKRLGFADNHVTVIGCPSMVVMDRNFTIAKPEHGLAENSRIAIGLEYAGHPYLGQVYQANEAHYRNLTAVYQTLAGGELVL